jgi:hypothetical protein
MVKLKFDKSERMKLWHERAKVQREIYKNQFPDMKLPSYSEFLKKETPVTSNIVVYDVSFQVNYKGEYEHFILPKQTFKIYGLAKQEHDIKDRAINMVQTSKGTTSKNMLSPETSVMLDSQLQVDVYPRGIEKSENIFVDKKMDASALKQEILELKTLSFNKYVVRDLDKTFKFKNKKGRTGEMSVDITNFL